MKRKILQTLLAVLVGAGASAQVNSGSNGSDGAFNPATSTVINMADHPNGIYQYTSVTISNGVTVTFIPNANNSPVTWLVQENCEIDGTVDVSGQSPGIGGPGGYSGGMTGSNPTAGQGPGGGPASLAVSSYGCNASYGSSGSDNGLNYSGPTYGNIFILPLIGGSGGSGSYYYGGFGGANGGGGGGAILIASSNQIQLTGNIWALGGSGTYIYNGGIQPVEVIVTITLNCIVLSHR